MAKKKSVETEIDYADLGDEAKKFISDQTAFEADQNQRLLEKEEKTRLGGINSAIVELLTDKLAPNAILKVLTDYYDRALNNAALSNEELSKHADKALASTTATRVAMEVIDKGITDGVIYFSLASEKRCFSATALFENYNVEDGLHMMSAVDFVQNGISKPVYYSHFFYINPETLDVIADSTLADMGDFKWAAFYKDIPTLFKKEG